MIFDSIENWRHYQLGDAWEKAFAFIEDLSPESDDDFYPLDGDRLYARVMSYETCMPQDAKIEAHQEFVDIQTAITATEGIDWFSRKQVEAITEYDSEKDVTYFSANGIGAMRIDVLPSMFVLFNPQDAHRPKQIETGGEQRLIKKAVVKIHRSLLGF